MHVIQYRFRRANYGSTADFIGAAQASLAGIAREHATQVGGAKLGVWLDPDRSGLTLRLVREHEAVTQQGIAWLPSRAFLLSEVEAAQTWLAESVT